MTVYVLAVVAASAGAVEAPVCELRTCEVGGVTRVQVAAGGRVLLSSPPEGLWSIATDWQEHWPAGWVHAHPQRAEAVGPWTVLRGTLRTPQGEWQCRDSYRPEGNRVRCVRRLEYRGQPAPRTTLSVRWQTPVPGAAALLPGTLYYGNPSGNRTGRGIVAAFSGRPGEMEFYEEHRYPMPFACLEWSEPAGQAAAALHTLPSPAAYGHLPDPWWSLGVAATPAGCELALLSGPCAIRDRRSHVKIGQRETLVYDDAWLDVPAVAVIEKTFWLEAFPVARPGAGFQRPVQTSLALFQPFDATGLPDYETIVRDKLRYAATRWLEGPGYAGFSFHPTHGPEIVHGWCGQADAPGYALPVLAPWLGMPEAAVVAQKSLDLLASAPVGPDGFPVRYEVKTGRWSAPDPVSEGQALENLARAVAFCRGRPGYDTSRWEDFLRRACAAHARRICRDDWRPVSTAEAFLVSPLCRASRLFADADCRAAALKAARHYADRHLSMREPYWGGTLDASCEDKEGAWAAFQAFLAVYDLTGEPAYLAWAEHACDVVLSYLVVWDIPLPPGRLADHSFRSRGWTAVSAQNQHLDVFGVVFAPAVYRLGTLTGRPDLQRVAAVMFRSCGQLIDPAGSQGEQIQQTNFSQGGATPTRAADARGGYNEHWTVFWITAHFLNAAAQFEEMGVRF